MIPLPPAGGGPSGRLSTALLAWGRGLGRQLALASRSRLVRVAGLLACYIVGGIAGKSVMFMSGDVALVWPPAGIALAGILLLGWRYWPVVALGSVLFSALNDAPWGVFTLCTAFGNTMGALLCNYLLERFVQFRPRMDRVRDVTGFVLLACTLGTTMNAAFNVVGSLYTGQLASEELFPALLAWWVPNAMAGLVLAPFILVWGSRSHFHWRWPLGVEAAVCGLGLLGGAFVSFDSWYVHGVEHYPLAYLPYPFLVWSALRFGQRGATTGTLLVSIMAIYELWAGRGPFVANTEKESLMLIGSYLGILAVTNLLLAAAAIERETAERVTRQSEERYRGVVESQTELISRFGPDGRLTFVNEAYCRFHGKSSAELLHTNFFQMLPPEDQSIPLQTLGSLSREDPKITFDILLDLSQGRRVWQQCTVQRLFDPAGHTLEFQAVARDITDRKQAEETLLKSEAMFQLITENVSDLIAVADAQGKRLYNSPGYRKVFDGSGVLRGTNAFEHIHPEDVEHVRRAFAETVRSGVGQRLEYRFVLDDGTVRYIESQGNFVPGDHGQPGKVVTISRDITERKQAETALRKATEAVEAGSRAKSQFLANMSHELRTPLNAIIGFSEVLMDKLFGDLNERQLRYVTNILNSGRHLLQLISDILDLAKVEAGRLELAISVFDPAAALNNVLTICKGLAMKKHIALEVEVEPNLPTLQADEAKFKQILYNLLSNAIKFTPEGGRVTVTAALEREDGAYRESQQASTSNLAFLRLAVADTGVGIHPKDQERIFQEFVQVDSSYARQQQGTGLGLTLTKRLVELHGGHIWVQSAGVEGDGSIFSVRFPVAREGPAVAPISIEGLPQDPAWKHSTCSTESRARRAA